MKTTLLAYSKVILSKVSFSEKLFGKELSKSVAALSPAERLDLHAWCNLHFGVRFSAVITAVFLEENRQMHAGRMPPFFTKKLPPCVKPVVQHSRAGVCTVVPILAARNTAAPWLTGTNHAGTYAKAGCRSPVPGFCVSSVYAFCFGTP